MAEHYFSTNPTGDEAPRKITVNLQGTQYQVTTKNGIFSPQGLDKGTAVLLHKIPEQELNAGDKILDLGCGWGAITLAMAKCYPNTEILSVDVNKRALELTAENARANGFINVRVSEANTTLVELQNTEIGFDLIVSNPPIRIGKNALHELLKNWLSLLKPTGKAIIVVQKNLGADSLASWLSTQNYTVNKLGSAKGFRVFQITTRH